MTEHPNPILDRILREAGTADLWPFLTDRLSPTDLQSLLLAVAEARAEKRKPSEVLRQYGENRFVHPAKVSPRQVATFDLLALELLPAGFEPLELSPVCPLGTISVLGPVDPKLAVATVRNTEVCSDATNVLALESAVRRRRTRQRVQTPTTAGAGALADDAIRLCASHRLMRAQQFKGPASFAHFRTLCLTTAGRDRGNHAFETGAMVEHLDFYLRLLAATSRIGLALRAVRVRILPISPGAAERAQQTVVPELQARHRDVGFAVGATGEQDGDYYQEARFQVFATAPDGTELFLADGGTTDWTQKLTGDRKERFFISGIGTDRLLSQFARV